jgi:hypothetical protein
MPALTMTDLKSKNYIVYAGDGQGRGTYYIEEIATGKTTLRDVGCEAWYNYRRFKRAWKTARADFDSLCRNDIIRFEHKVEGN